ncbi:MULTISPECIES: hypothetical protein [unclassified Rhodanobacter]|nr:hypothetical protein [Rhodanobacter sp. OR444]TAN17974.1 MAG: hypothetical protein EPN35_05485 [Rhodanobacter sp.]
MGRIILFAALAIFALPVFAATQSYADAKALADRDEASVSKAQSAALLASQKAAIERIVTACAGGMGPAGMPPFVVVVELDAAGKVAATWREGSSDFAVCFQKQLGTLSLFTPPRAPFYTSFEMSMSPGD